MASLSSLPTELIEYIVSYLSQPGLYAICQANRYLHQLAIPLLYRHVDLLIPEGGKTPRIDWFCLNIMKDSRKAARVDSIRLGPSARGSLEMGLRYLPRDDHIDDEWMLQKAMDVVDSETVDAGDPGDSLRDDILMREYSSYALVILLILPSLQRLDLAEYLSASFGRLHKILRHLQTSTVWSNPLLPRTFLHRLSSIKHISFNFDKHSGEAYRETYVDDTFGDLLVMPSTTKLEISIPSRRVVGGRFSIFRQRLLMRDRIRPTNITSLVVRHSPPTAEWLPAVFECMPHLRSLTYEIWMDLKNRDDEPSLSLSLHDWNDRLMQIRDTLEVLVLSVEYSDRSSLSFKQPRIGNKLQGRLDLTMFGRLHSLEVPLPFLTGDAEFSMMTEIRPFLPPNLKYLSLRSDLSHGQFSFPLDLSSLMASLTFEESRTEARIMMNARMDASYMFQASLTLLDQAVNLETIAVWQPTDASLGWFEGQVADFATTCRNKNVTGKIVMPMLMRWKKAEHWDLINEVTVFNRADPTQGRQEKLFRQEWDDRPLGLASQYHLHALRTRRVRLRR